MRTITWYVAAEEQTAEKKGAGKAGKAKTGTAKTVLAFTADVKKAAVRDGRPVVHHVEIRGDDDGTD